MAFTDSVSKHRMWPSLIYREFAGIEYENSRGREIGSDSGPSLPGSLYLSRKITKDAGGDRARSSASSEQSPDFIWRLWGCDRWPLRLVDERPLEVFNNDRLQHIVRHRRAKDLSCGEQRSRRQLDELPWIRLRRSVVRRADPDTRSGGGTVVAEKRR